jgi:hypothetical protein
MDVKKESGCMFYSPPDALDEWMDPMMRPVCEEINRSGWVWTAESCQGHPDAEKSGTWGHNTRPMLRLVTKDESVGRMWAAIMEAYEIERRATEESIEEHGNMSELIGLSVYPMSGRNPGWSEVLIYIEAKTVYQRNEGMGVWENFGKIVNRKS